MDIVRKRALHRYSFVLRASSTAHRTSAILHDTVVNVLHRAGWRTITERLRYDDGHFPEGPALLGTLMAGSV